MKPLEKISTIGVMSVVHEGKNPFGMQTYFFEDMVNSISDLQVDIFFFSPLEWKSDSNTIRGYKFINSKWIEVIASIPEIIYDRSFSSDTGQKASIETFRHFLKKSKKIILNPFELAELLNDKIEFHTFLLENEIPSLRTFPLKAILEVSFFNSIDSSRVYVKPTFGSKGKGIFVIEKQEDSFTLYDNLGNAVHFNSYASLIEEMLIEVSSEDYFVQEEAKIQYFEDAPFDVRVMVQNYGNDYKVTGSAVRVGKKKSMTSNLNSGGIALPLNELDTFLKEQYNYNIDELKAAIEKLCLDCTDILRSRFGEFCEIGYDILITKDHGPIILEANAKPSRWVFVKIADHLESLGKDNRYFLDRRKETVSVPMKYASYLAKKKN